MQKVWEGKVVVTARVWIRMVRLGFGIGMVRLSKFEEETKGLERGKWMVVMAEAIEKGRRRRGSVRVWEVVVTAQGKIKGFGWWMVGYGEEEVKVLWYGRKFEEERKKN